MQETIIQRIQILDEKYYQHTQKLESLIEQNVHLKQNGDIINAEESVKRSDLKILLVTSEGLILYNIISVHDEGIRKCKDIIAQIDNEFK